MIKQVYKTFLIGLIYLVSAQALTAQLWELLFDPFIVQGIYYAAFAGPNEPTWQETTFARFPYDNPDSGLFLPTSLVGDKSRFQAFAHFQNNERRTTGGMVQLKYAPISLITAEATYLQLFDKERGADNKIGVTSFNLSYNRFRLPKIHFWWGVGGLFVKESEDTLEDNKAFTMNLGVNYYFKKPLSLYGSMQMGEINDSFGALSEARVQVHLERFLIYAGYQDINFGAYKYSGVALGGGVYF